MLFYNLALVLFKYNAFLIVTYKIIQCLNKYVKHYLVKFIDFVFVF